MGLPEDRAGEDLVLGNGALDGVYVSGTKGGLVDLSGGFFSLECAGLIALLRLLDSTFDSILLN